MSSPLGSARGISFGGVVRDAAGNLYGTTELGGTYGLGTVFEVDAKTHKETVLHSFTGKERSISLRRIRSGIRRATYMALLSLAAFTASEPCLRWTRAARDRAELRHDVGLWRWL